MNNKKDLPTIVVLEAPHDRHTLLTWLVEGMARLTTDLGSLGTPASSGIVVVDLAEDLERALHTVESVRATAPDAHIVALAESKDPVTILRAMRAGAREFGVLDEGGEIADIVKALLARTSKEKPGGLIVSVFPAKGGVGATTVATNLAGALCREGKHVLLVDVDRQLGNVLVFLDMAARFSIADVAKNVHRLDRELLLSSLARHESGIYVLTQPDSLEDQEAVSAAAPVKMPELLQFLARHFDYLVCDGLRGFDELALSVLDASHRVELLLTQDVVALKNAKRCLEIFHRLKYDDRKVGLVVNRFLKKSTVDLASIADNLGIEVRAILANDHPAAISAINRGLLLSEVAPQSQLTEDVIRLAAQISGTKSAPSRPKRRGFAAFFGRSDPPPSLREPAKPSTDPKPTQKGGAKLDVTRRTSETS